jgi:hypothetical protein
MLPGLHVVFEFVLLEFLRLVLGFGFGVILLFGFGDAGYTASQGDCECDGAKFHYPSMVLALEEASQDGDY